MPIRMTGIASGLDTDAIVQELMQAQSMKKQKVVNKQTTLTWTQEIWKELNTKLYNFYTGSLTDLKTQGKYKTKKVSSSNENAVKATATGNAATGAHSLKIMALASSQFVTSGKVGITTTNADGSISTSKATTKSTLTSLGMEEGTAITIKNGDKEEVLTVESGTTVKDFLDKCKSAGLTANFDEKQQRFFISSVKSGADNAFNISTGTSNRVGADKAIKGLISNAAGTDDSIYDNYIAAADKIKAKLETAVAGSTTDDLVGAAIKVLNCVRDDTTTEAEKNAVLTRYNITEEEYNEFANAFNAGRAIDTRNSITTLNDTMSDYLGGVANASEVLQNFNVVAANDDTIVFKSELTAAYNNLKGLTADAYTTLKGLDLTDDTYTDDDFTLMGLTRQQFNSYKLLTEHVDKAELDTQMDIYIANEVSAANPRPDGSSQLTALGLDEIDSTGKTSADDIVAANSNVMSVKWAADAEIELDGAILTDSSNEFTVNGITLNLTATTYNKTTKEYEEVQLNVTNDTSAVYDMVKGFVKEYNDLLKEMNEKYNAKSSRGYDPLTDEQKEAMTDDEIEKWETKIKDSLLRRDDTLNSLTSAMRTAMMSTVKVNGKTYSLASLGIRTSSDYTEKGLLHIYGDEDDDTYATQTNLLKNMLEEDPDVVMEVLSNAAKTLYDSFTKKMERTSLSSALKFYNDKQMETQQRNYAKEISNWDKKLQDMEDRYYAQFTAMEKAMANLQNQSNYLASMLGTSA